MSAEEGDWGISRELAMRMASAAVLIPFGLVAVWKGGLALSAVAALCAAAMAFEWSRMARSQMAVLMIGGVILANLVHPIDARWALMLLIAAGALASLFDHLNGRGVSALLGTLYTGGLPLALQALRTTPDAGFVLAMGIMLLSWSSDTSAYFVGRQFGGPLLSPQDSPNKTWSGALGAVVGSVIAACIFSHFVGGPLLLWALAGVFVSIMAQIGDLFESQMKRQHGVKDTSGILPGHGGVMDRLDGFGTASVAALALTRVIPELPNILAGG
ncbi:MAG: phosphatidate cytidylyltransferase [Pseudomonadota bacterium]